MRIFYGVHLKSSQLSTALDVIRFIGESDNIRFSHVTLRGPYDRPLPRPTLVSLNCSKQRKWVIRLAGVGSFFARTQNTIMIRVDLLELSDLVFKPDYADSIPHITLYDGKDRDYAEKLLHMLYKYDFHQSVEVNQLQRLSSKAPVGGNFSVLYDEFNKYYHHVINKSPDDLSCRLMTQVEKLKYVEHALNENFSKIADKLLRPVDEQRQEELPFPSNSTDETK